MKLNPQSCSIPNMLTLLFTLPHQSTLLPHEMYFQNRICNYNAIRCPKNHSDSSLSKPRLPTGLSVFQVCYRGTQAPFSFCSPHQQRLLSQIKTRQTQTWLKQKSTVFSGENTHKYQDKKCKVLKLALAEGEK